MLSNPRNQMDPYRRICRLINEMQGTNVTRRSNAIGRLNRQEAILAEVRATPAVRIAKVALSSRSLMQQP
jgi:hypothetical protein